MAVVLRVGAEMQCEEAGCPDRAPAELILLGTGTLAFKPKEREHGWEVALPGGSPLAPYATRCPKHKRSGLVTTEDLKAATLATRGLDLNRSH